MKTKSLIMRKLKSALIAKVFFILTFIIGLKGQLYDDKRRLDEICATVHLFIPKQLVRKITKQAVEQEKKRLRHMFVKSEQTTWKMLAKLFCQKCNAIQSRS